VTNRIILKQFYINNWAQFKDTWISFAKGEQNVSYFIGKNAAGKTTLLNAIYYVLFKSKKSQFKIEDVLNKKAIENQEKPLKLELKIEFVVENEYNQRTNYEISRVWTFDEESTVNKVKLKDNEVFNGIKKIGDSIEKLTEKDYNQKIQKLIPPAVRDYYFLDGEQLRDLFDQSKLKSIKTLSLNLSDILKVEALITLLEKFGKYLNNEAKKGGKMGSNTATLMDRINDLHEKENEIRAQIEEKQNIIDRNEVFAEEIYKKIRNLLEKENKIKLYNSLIKKKDINLNKLNKINNQLNNLLSKSYPLILLDQKGILEWLKLDLENKNKIGEIPAPIDASIIMNILQTNRCICKRELDNDCIGYFNDLKDNLPTASLNSAVRDFTNKLTRKMEKLSRSKNQIFQKQSQLNQLNAEKNDITDKIEELLDEVGKTEESSLDDINRHKKLQTEISTIKNELGKLEKDLETIENQMQKLQSRFKALITRLNKIGAKSKGFYYSKNMDALSILNKLKSSLINKIRNHIQETTNEVFLNIIWDRDNWQGIEIGKDWSVCTKDRDGIPYQNMSAGQNHVLGISFMSSLTAITGLKIPFVFDSPFGRISEEPIEMIGKYLPSLMKGSQIILFVTDTENENIYDFIKNAIGKNYVIEKINANSSKIYETDIK